MKKENLTRAFKEAGNALTIDRESIYARTALARAYKLNREYSEAVKIYGELTNEKAGPAYWRDYGYCLFITKDFTKADEIFTHMIDNEMYKDFAFYMKYFIEMERGNITDAHTFLNRAIELAPENEEYLAKRNKLDQIMLINRLN